MSSVAALWDELTGEEDLFGELLSASFGATAAGGKPFLTDILGTDARLMVEAAFGADLTGNPDLWNWYDITADVRQADGNKVSIGPMGRSDEASQSQPAGCGFQLDNTSGAYTANHPGSPWFPYVRRNTPVRVRLYVNGMWSTRFQGYANGWVPSWDTSCNLAVVTVSASGVLRRLNQGKTPLRSPLYRAINGGSPVAYWPLEDASGATQASSGVVGGTALKATSTSPKFGSVSAAGSAPIADFGGGGQLTGSITSSTDGSFRVEFIAVFASGQTAPAPYIKPLTWYTTGTYYEWFVQVNGPGGFNQEIEVAFRPSDGSSLVELITAFVPYDGKAHHYRIDVVQSGANQVVTFYVDGVDQIDDGFLHRVATVGHVTGVVLNQEGETSSALPAIGHLAVWAPITSGVDTVSASTGYAGEAAVARLARLCGEQGVPLAIVGTSDTAMGAQTVDTFSNLIRECETTDDGLLYDGLGPGLGYVTRQARYNVTAALTPDMSADPPQVDDPFQPADDDQRNRNLVKVDRKGGSSAISEDVTGTLGANTVGTYDTSVAVNTQTDGVLLYRAAWEVHKGTVTGFRYPTLGLDLAATPALVPAWLASPLASRIDVLNVTSKATQHPPGTVSVLLEGYSEVLSPFDWTVAANCSPYDPWRVAVIESTSRDTLWRVDAGGSTLAADAPAGATSLSVASTDGYLLSTAGGDFPVDLDVGGVKVTATAVTGSSSPQTVTVTATAYPLKSGWTVHLWRPPAIAL